MAGVGTMKRMLISPTPTTIERDGDTIVFYWHFNGVKREVYYLVIEPTTDLEVLHMRMREKRWYTPQVEAVVDTLAEQILA